MKWILPVLALLGSTGCFVQNDSPIRVLGAHALKPSTSSDSTCTLDDVNIIGGSLDISAHPFYDIAFDIESGLQAISTTTGGQTIADPSRNNYYADEVQLTYSSTPALTFEQESVPLHFVIEPQAKTWVRFDLLTPKAITVLAQGVTPGNPVTLHVQFEFRGTLSSGERLRSNSVVYPIDVFTTSFTSCGMGTLLKANGGCGAGGGQDGIPVICCPVDPMDPTKCKGS